MSTDERVTKDLIETLEDGKKGFAHAADRLADSDRSDLSSKMREFSNQRAQFSSELEEMAANYGDDIDEGGSVGGAIHRGWMSVMDAITGADPEGVVDAALQGEEHAVSEYEDALSKEITAGLRETVQRQFDAIKMVKGEIERLAKAVD